LKGSAFELELCFFGRTFEMNGQQPMHSITTKRMSRLKPDIVMPLKFRQLFDPKNFCIYAEICIKMIVHEIVSTFIGHYTVAPFPW
jgi:hypothetical protein